MLSFFINFKNFIKQDQVFVKFDGNRAENFVYGEQNNFSSQPPPFKYQTNGQTNGNNEVYYQNLSQFRSPAVNYFGEFEYF